MTLRDEILARQDCADAVAARDLDAIAALMSNGRTRVQSRFVTARTIQAEIDGGAAILKKFEAAQASIPDLEYALVFLKQDSGYDFGNAKAQGMADQLATAAAGNVITLAEAAALKGLALQAAPVSRLDVELALFNPDGSMK